MYVYMIIDTKNVKVQRRHGHGHGQMVNTSNFVFFRSEFKANCHCKVPYRRSFALNNVVSLHPGIQRELATINYWRNPAME